MRLALVALLSVLLVQVLPAQEVRGTVTDRATGTPQPGVVVQLLDSSGLVVARTLTDAAGGYRLAAREAGRHVVRVLRIGYRPADEAVTLRPAQVAQVLLHAGAAISLATVRVASRRTCEVHPDSGSITFAVWEQIRTSLVAAQITASRQFITSAVTYERVLDPTGNRVIRQGSRIRDGVSGEPWRSVSADSLSRVGYVVTEGTGVTTYFVPDLAVLTSARFTAEHCLRLASNDTSVGIAFEPTRERRHLPEIAGTLWLDRATSALRSLDYRYVHLTRQQEAVAGGALEFARIASGEHLIVRWLARVPVVETRYGAGGALRGGNQVAGRAVREVREDGGSLSLVRSREDTLWARPSLQVGGNVRDAEGTAVADARVALRGTALFGMSDGAGRFVIPDVIPGTYTLDVQAPAQMALGARQSVPLSLTAARMDLDLRVPADRAIAARACGPTAGLLAGRIVQADGSPAPGAVAIVQWTEYETPQRAINERWRELDAQADARGYFKACGVRSRHPLHVRAEGRGGSSTRHTVRIPRDSGMIFVALRMDQPPAIGFSIAGRVIAAANGMPLPETEVLVPASGRTVVTGPDGRFRLGELPGGTHEVLVRRVGYQAARASVALGAVPTTDRNFVLSRVAALDTVAVVAQPRLIEFERNREMGFGSFLTRADIAKYELQDFPEVIAHLPGIYVRRVGGAGYVTGTRGKRTTILLDQPYCDALRFESTAPEPASACACYVQVYVDNTLLYGAMNGQVVPNISNILTSDVEAVEFYASAAQTPARYSRLNAHCGVLVVHTRRYGTPDASASRPPP